MHHPIAAWRSLQAYRKNFGDIGIDNRRRIGVDDSLLHELDVFNKISSRDRLVIGIG